MPDPSVDSLSPQPDAALPPSGSAVPPEPGHIDVAPIGPSASSFPVAGAPIEAPATNLPLSQSSINEIEGRSASDTPQPSPEPTISTAEPGLSTGIITPQPLVGAASVAQPVIETHRGTIPVPPQRPADEVGTRASNVDTPWMQRPVYLWLLLLVGVIFLCLLAFVYFGGIYQRQQ